MIFDIIIIVVILICFAIIKWNIYRVEVSIEFYGKQVMTLIRWKEKIEKEQREKEGGDSEKTGSINPTA